jgi:rhamnogalacturonan endolyase
MSGIYFVRFHYMALSDSRKRTMPMPEDRVSGQPLAYPEAVLLTKPINLKLRGEVTLISSLISLMCQP